MLTQPQSRKSWKINISSLLVHMSIIFKATFYTYVNDPSCHPAKPCYNIISDPSREKEK